MSENEKNSAKIKVEIKFWGIEYILCFNICSDGKYIPKFWSKKFLDDFGHLLTFAAGSNKDRIFTLF